MERISSGARRKSSHRAFQSYWIDEALVVLLWLAVKARRLTS